MEEEEEDEGKKDEEEEVPSCCRVVGEEGGESKESSPRPSRMTWTDLWGGREGRRQGGREGGVRDKALGGGGWRIKGEEISRFNNSPQAVACECAWSGDGGMEGRRAGRTGEGSAAWLGLEDRSTPATS